jgi:hypothetical protein
LGTETLTGVLDVSGSEFHADGVFNKGEGDPTWAAVLAFVNVYLGGGVDPVLYLHPRFQGDLPETLTSIERRLVRLLVESISLGKGQQDGRAEIQITYRFGPPPASDAESIEDSSMSVFKNGSRS